ncbi:hypothetical protein STIUS_v1c02500 [Spiroplasma sp. TIUS-1]|uniref:SPE_1075/MLC_0560 family membrane protein n=1 Tax=Spiroplasma sp. TIUS-1 TaxID=216963 RepID=UPI00139776DD|nr:hypothetical protein [Spiroplasma sp. TIUS-1]QHX35805.1 hypothetical protein STIUS_v1c02500 [Spiroplasma sp. TIUS-1]
MFLLKTKFNYFIKDINLNKRNYFFKLIALILGMYLFSIGITISANTAVGVSMIDITILGSIFHSHGLADTSNGVVSGTINTVDTPYELYVAYIYIGMSIVSLCFMSVWVYKSYKKTGNKMLFVQMLLSVICDIIVIFAIPLLIKMNYLYMNPDGIRESASTIRAYLFLIAFICYSLGIALWVYSGFLPGPYNSICTNFIKMFEGMSYSFGRTIMNILIFIPGVLIILLDGATGHRTWQEVLDFTLVNISFGSVFLILILGPMVTWFNKYIPKIFVMKPHVDFNQPVQTSINMEEL